MNINVVCIKIIKGNHRTANNKVTKQEERAKVCSNARVVPNIVGPLVQGCLPAQQGALWAPFNLLRRVGGTPRTDGGRGREEVPLHRQMPLH